MDQPYFGARRTNPSGRTSAADNRMPTVRCHRRRRGCTNRLPRALDEVNDQPVESPAAFTLTDNWLGGFYELAVELGEADDQRLGSALEALWHAAGVVGCYGNQEREPQEMATVPCSAKSLASFGHLRGLVTLPNGVPMVCGAVAVRETEGPTG